MPPSFILMNNADGYKNICLMSLVFMFGCVFHVRTESREYKEGLLRKDIGSFAVCEGCKLEQTAAL